MKLVKQNPKLVQKTLSNGQVSLFLEYYLGREQIAKTNDIGEAVLYTSGKMAGRPMYIVKHNRKKVKLGLYFQSKPRTPEERQQRKDVLALAEKIRYEKEQAFLQDKEGYSINLHQSVDFISFYREYYRGYELKDKRNIALSLKKFEAFLQEYHPRFVIGQRPVMSDENTPVLDKQGNPVYEMVYSLKPENINEELVKQFIKFLEAQCKYSGAATLYARFQKVCRHATKKGVMKHNPCADLEPKDKPSDKAEEKTPLTSEQLQQLCNTHYLGENPEIQRAFIFCCLTGLRWCDCKELRYSNVDYESCTLSFDQAKTKHSAKAENYSVKMPLEASALELIGELGEHDKEDYIFSLPSHTMCLKALRRWTNRAGIEGHYTWHCARVTFATLLLDSNVNVAMIQSLLGHSSLKYINIYAKARDSKKREAIKAAMPALSFSASPIEEVKE